MKGLIRLQLASTCQTVDNT